MQRPRLIASRTHLDEAIASLKPDYPDALAAVEYRALKQRTDTIFAMPLLSYTQTPPMVSRDLFTMPPVSTPAPTTTMEATPLALLPHVDSFGAFTTADPFTGRLEGLGFKPKGHTANEIGKAGLSRVQALALVWHLSEDRRYAKRCIDEMLALCILPHWGDQFLATAMIIQALAVGYDWLHEDMDEAAREFIARALLEKGIAPALGHFTASTPPNWVTVPSNWNIVANASLIMAALALEPDVADPRVPAVKSAALASLQNGLKLLDDDGSWKLEGPGYWHLATEHLTYLVAAVATAEPALLPKVETAGLRHLGRYRSYVSGPTKLLFNHGDSPEERPGLWWLRWVGGRYGLAHCHELADDRTGATGAAPEVHPMDVIWRRRDRSNDRPLTEPLEHLPLAAVFCETAVMRGAWHDANAPYVGIKGGETSGRRSHSHLDLGHFVYDVGGRRWAVDLEPDEYSDCYLTPPERYRYYRTASFGHNTLVIGHKNQAYPANTGAAPIAARFMQPQISPCGTSIAVDLTAAYPAVRSVVRTFDLATDGALTITDELTSAEAVASVTWSLHTRATVECDGTSATLSFPANDTQPACRMIATIAAGDGAVFTASPAAAAEPYTGCGMAEASNPDVMRLTIELAAPPANLKLVVHLALVA